MSGSIRKVSVFLLSVVVPAIATGRAEAQDAPLLRPSPTFIVQEAPATPDFRIRRASAAGVQTRPQPPTRRGSFFGWELEIHAGGSWSRASHGGLTQPPQGQSFTTLAGTQSRQVRSWYFGDGADVLNVNLAAAGMTARLAALDEALTPSSVGPGGANPFGVRLTRPFTPRIGIEFAFDLLGAYDLTSEAREAAEQTRASFQSAFSSRFAGFTGVQVTSTLGTTSGGRQMLVTGAVNLNLGQRGRLAPYVVFGGGVWAASGDAPTIALAGDYRFISGSGTSYRQTDELDVEYRSGSSFAMLLGAGLRFALNDRSGVRVDLRGHFATDPASVVINWRPATIPGPVLNTIILGSTLPIQISNGTPLSTLSLTQTTPDFEVASADSMRQLLNFTVGYYYRFQTTRTPAAQGASARASQGSQLWQGNRRWEVDVHGGGAFGNQPSSGRAGTFPTGATFTTTSGGSSRYASTWMFGDGAVLINQLAGGFAGGIPVADRMSSLNPMLTTASLDRARSGSVGARFSRRLTSRVRAELAVESTGGSLTLTEAARAQINATRASFIPVWNGIIGTGPTIFLSPQVAAMANVTDSTSRWQTSITGGLEIRIWNSAKMIGYVNGGAGVIKRSANAPEASLTGTYQFLFNGVAPLSERDAVRIHYQTKSGPVVVFGGGMKYFLTARRGIRADLRIHTSGNSLDTLVDATPSMTPGTPTFVISSFTTPSVIFSNTTATRGNLTGPAISDLKTFTATGKEMHVSATAGYFFRF